MTDLSAKFGQLETNLGAKLDLVVSGLGTVASKLDDLIAAIAAGGGSTDAAAIVAAIADLRGAGPDNTIERVTSAIFGLAGPAPGVTLTQIHGLLEAALFTNTGGTLSPLLFALATYNQQLADATGDRAGGSTLLELMADGLYTQPEAPLNLRLPYLLNLQQQLTADGASLSLYELLDNLNAATGGVPYENLNLASVRGFLNAIQSSTSNLGVLPDGTTLDRIQSSGSITDAGKRFVVWGSAIAGVNRSEDMTRLTPSVNWTDYEVYIQSDATQFDCIDHTNNVTVQFSTNTWVDISALITLGNNVQVSFNVPANFNVIGYIRTPDSASYIVFNSVAGAFNSTSYQVINATDWISIGYVLYAPATSAWNPDVYVTGAMERTIILTGGANVRIQYNAGSATRTLVQGANVVTFASSAFNCIGNAGTPFTLQVSL